MSSFVPTLARTYALHALNRPYATAASGALLYVLLVRALRYRRANSWGRKYGFTDRASFSNMTLDQAQKINRELASQEFPLTFAASLFFALFKTYGIPSISRLLVATNQLASEKTVSKRAADTSVIMTEVVVGEPSSERHISSLARVNYLHSRYRKAGKITDDDMLYTLSLFALEPVRWTGRLEWRDLSEVEQCALGLFWREVGRGMEISYDDLQPYIKDTHDDGLTWLNALDAWSVEYETKNMVPATTNKQVADSTLYLAFYNTPWFLKSSLISVVTAIFEPRLRAAVMLPDPGPVHRAILHTYLGVRKYTLRYLALPRPYLLRRRMISDVDPKTGRIHLIQYITHPWYVKPTWSARWGLGAWYKRLLGGTIPGDGGDKYQPEGYLIHEVGPEYQKGKGAEEMAKDKERLAQLRKTSGCPMSGFSNAVKN